MAKTDPPAHPLLVSVELGATLPTGDFANIRPLIRIDNIDPSGDVDRQLALGLETAARAIAEIDGQLDVVVSEIISPESGRPGYRARVDALESQVQQASVALRKLMERLRDTGVLSATTTAVMETSDKHAD